MGLSSKFVRIVALVLLVASGALPVLASIPCQELAASTMRCRTACSQIRSHRGQRSGAEARCNRMAAMDTSSATTPLEVQGNIGLLQSDRSCCKVSPDAPVPMTTSARSAVCSQASFVRDAILNSALPATPKVEGYRPSPDRQPVNRSQAILCTFLI